MEALVARATRVLLSAILSFALTASAAASPVTGSVVDASGAAVVRAFVRLVDAAGRERSATITDDRGRFALDLDACADCHLEASLVGFRTSTLAVTATQSADAMFQPRLMLQVAPIADTVVVTPTRDAPPPSQSGQSVSVFPADRLALACSLGLEDVALVEMLARLPKVPRIFFLDTGRLHQETYDLLQQLRRHYGVPIEIFCPAAEAVEALVRRDGPNGFYEGLDQRRACCAVRKVEPLRRALRGADAWITGLRRDQAPTRRDLRTFELDADHGGLLKINPLLEWDHARTLAYVRHHGVPVNALHDQGFPSIGCAPCTRPVQPGAKGHHREIALRAGDQQ